MKPQFFVAYWLLAVLPATAQRDRVLPANPGFYILKNSVYELLIPAPIQSLKPKIGRAILNGYSLGLAGNRMVLIVPGTTAPTQTGTRPTFLIVNGSRAIAASALAGGLNPRALEIVKLDKKKSHREVNILHGTSWNPSIGLPDAKWPFAITPVGNSAYQLTLSSDLARGEYLVLSEMIANGYNGFDFTVNSEIASETPTSQSASSAEDARPPSGILPGARLPLQNSALATMVPPKGVGAIATVSDHETPANSSASAFEEVLIGITFTGKPTVRHDGVEISGVQPKGPADEIDMRPGDFILAIDDHYLFTIDELRAELLRHEPGTKMKIRYRRNQLTYESDLILGTKAGFASRQ